MEKVVIKELRDLPLSQIEIGEGNVRKSQAKAGLEELKASISRFGLIHPIIVIQKTTNRFELIVGQRRFLAFKELGKTSIPALVVNPLTPAGQRIVSFGENIHRRNLPYDDTIRVCDQLYKEYSGPKFERIQRIAKDVSVSPNTVAKYLSYRLVPSEVQKLVTSGELSADVAYRITTAFWPNIQKITKIARYATRMTKSEWQRALDIGRKRPQASADEIAEEAKKAPVVYEIVVHVDSKVGQYLEKIASQRNMDVRSLVKSLIDTFLEEEGQM